jgi:hypothetical protein
MREGIDIEVSAADRERLAAVVGDRNSRQKHVWRARIILATAEGCGTAEIMRRAGVSKLISQGIKPDVISAKGFGDTHPVAPNDTPANRAKNRRIVITVQGPGAPGI